MTLVVEDGSIVVGANCYVDAATVVAYALDRGVIMTEAEATIYIYKLMPYYESFNYQGYIVNKDQELLWPRKCVYYRGYLLEDDEIPDRFKNAFMEHCIALHQGFDPQATIQNEVKEESFAVFKVVYKDNASIQPIIQRAWSLLSPFIEDGGNGIHMKVERSYD